MDYNTLTSPVVAMSAEAVSNLVAAHSLYETLQQLPDPRRGQGKRYCLAVLLCFFLLAKLAGEPTLSGAPEWIRHRADQMAEHFCLTRLKMPCQMTYCRILASIDVKQLDELLAAFFTRWEAEQRCGNEPSRLQSVQGKLDHAQLAIDGKTVRATSKQAHSVHLLSCYDVTTGTLLWQCNVAEKQNEISALKPLITPALVKGRVFTLDAMHSQRELCAQIERFGGAYLLMAKDNQLTLAEDITDLFADPTPERRRWQEAETWDKGHGRLEHRQVICRPDLGDWFAKEWQAIAQVVRLQRRTITLKTGEIAQQIVYGLSNLPMRHAPPLRILQLVRHQWKIENRLPWRRDVTLGEDACQTRTGPAPSVLARLNSTVVSLMDRLGVGNVAKQLRSFDAHPEQAIQLLLTGSCSAF